MRAPYRSPIRAQDRRISIKIGRGENAWKKSRTEHDHRTFGHRLGNVAAGYGDRDEIKENVLS